MIGSRPPDAPKLARRRQERLTELEPEALRRLEAGEAIRYDLNGELVKEYADGRRFVVHPANAERPDAHIRELLSDEEHERIRVFVETSEAVARARDFGVDISLTLANALLTPEERWHRVNAAIAQAQRLQGSAKRNRPDPI